MLNLEAPEKCEQLFKKLRSVGRRETKYFMEVAYLAIIAFRKSLTFVQLLIGNSKQHFYSLDNWQVAFGSENPLFISSYHH